MWPCCNHRLYFQGLTTGIFGPALMDFAEIYKSEPNDIALFNSMSALGTLVGSIFGESELETEANLNSLESRLTRNRFPGGFFFKYINDQILMFIMMVVYALSRVLTPFFSNLVILHVLGFIGGFVIGIFEIGELMKNTIGKNGIE